MNPAGNALTNRSHWPARRYWGQNYNRGKVGEKGSECLSARLVLSPTGRLNDVYHDYKYTYQGCGIILIVASVFLAVAMGTNYRLLDKEKKEEERKAKLEAKDQPRAAARDPEHEAAVPLTAAGMSKLEEDAV